MLDRLRLAVPIVLIIPLMTLCCTSDSAENLTGPMGPTDGESDPSYDVTGDWAFSTYRGSDIVCTWHLELEMAANGKISGSGKKGFVTLFVPGTHYIDDEPPGYESNTQLTAMYDHPVVGLVSSSRVGLRFNACDYGAQDFIGILVSDGEMRGSGWIAEVLPESPAAPNDLRAVAIDAHTLEFRWQDNSDVETGFDWRRSDSCYFNEHDYKWGEIKANAARFTVTGVPTNACVSFQIRAFRNAGKHGILRSAWTPWLHVRMP